MYRIVVHRNVSYCIVSYYIVSCRSISYCVVVYRIVSYRIVLHRIESYQIVLHRIISYCIVPCWFTLLQLLVFCCCLRVIRQSNCFILLKTLSSDYYKVISFCLRKIPMIKFLRDKKNISTWLKTDKKIGQMLLYLTNELTPKPDVRFLV